MLFVQMSGVAKACFFAMFYKARTARPAADMLMWEEDIFG